MELKKYVLTEDGCIYNKKQVKIHENGEPKYVVTFDIMSYHPFNIKKTSDNILDLVDSMDLIGCKVNNRFINNEFIYMVIDNPMFLADMVFFLANGDRVYFRDNQYDDEEKYADIKKNGIEVISIYKRQPNGHYKRYEVEK